VGCDQRGGVAAGDERGDAVLPRWTSRLGGAAAFTHGHCPAMTIALAHEWGKDAG
jgi:hypothetical protein